jgi:hypothetical protein
MRLADVELQLIMHGLDALSLLHLAQCSSRLLHAAQSPFAWKCTTLDLSFTVPGPSSLLRQFVNVSLKFCAPRPAANGSVPAFDEAYFLGLDLLANNLNVTKLDLSKMTFRHFNVKQLKRTLSSRRLRDGLRVLVLHRPDTRIDLPEGMVKLVTSLTRLHTLHMCPGPGDANRWKSLHNMKGLTDLHIADGVSDVPRSCLPFVAQCVNLRHLRILGPSFCEGAWRNFFASPNMQRLQSLHIKHFAARTAVYTNVVTVPPQDYAEAFASLKDLHTLQLSRVEDVDAMLVHVHLAPNLRMLVVDSSGSAVYTPSDSVLKKLLSSAPNLHCKILSPKYQAALFPQFLLDLAAPLIAAFGRFSLGFA